MSPELNKSLALSHSPRKRSRSRRRMRRVGGCHPRTKAHGMERFTHYSWARPDCETTSSAIPKWDRDLPKTHRITNERPSRPSGATRRPIDELWYIGWTNFHVTLNDDGIGWEANPDERPPLQRPSAAEFIKQYTFLLCALWPGDHHHHRHRRPVTDPFQDEGAG